MHEEPHWRDWLRAAQAGDRVLYGRLLAELLPPLRRAARGRWPGIGAADVEDIVQETLLALHRSLRLYDGDRPVAPFVIGIMGFRGADVVRARAKTFAREKEIDGAPETSGDADPNDYGAAGVDVAKMKAALATLPDGQRRALETTKLGEMPLTEASAVTGMTVAALKVATHRGIKSLRRAMTGKNDDGRR
ncbi:MAG: sigma-70 family RNA polymerase sigma factor [Hyphomicrobiales bacterium]|nr:sigma-70 family RNA polymerase sigma factor [Hyphomicrobiales bacterium]